MFFSKATRPTWTRTGRSGGIPWRRRKTTPFPPLKRSSSMPVGMIATGT